MTINKWLRTMFEDSILNFTFLCYRFTNNVSGKRKYTLKKKTTRIYTRSTVKVKYVFAPTRKDGQR